MGLDSRDRSTPSKQTQRVDLLESCGPPRRAGADIGTRVTRPADMSLSRMSLSTFLMLPAARTPQARKAASA